MKRSLILVQQQPYDWEAAKKQIEEIAEHFAAYLSEYRSKRATGSKHAVLGPVGKLLNKAAAGERNLESLLGFTVRIHEMSSKRGYLSPDALGHLRQGAEGLLSLLDSAPLSARDRLISQVDDSVYYLCRKGLYEYLESKRQEFAVFLQAKYDDDEGKFETAWGKDAVAFDKVRYPGPHQRRTAKAAKAADIAEFWQSQKEEPIEEEEEIE